MRKAAGPAFPSRYLCSMGLELPEQKGGLGTVRNATLLLRMLSGGERFQTLSSLAEASGLSLATTHRVLRSLAQADLVVQHPQSSRYSLGPRLLPLSGAHPDRPPLRPLLAPYLVEGR